MKLSSDEPLRSDVHTMTSGRAARVGSPNHRLGRGVSALEKKAV